MPQNPGRARTATAPDPHSPHPDSPLPGFADIDPTAPPEHPVAPEPDDLVTVERGEPGGRVVVLRIVGEVDTVSAPLVGRRIGEVLDAGERLVLDLSGVRFFGTAGMALLIRARGDAVRHDTGLWLAAPPRAVTRPMSVCGLVELFEITGTVGDAVALASR